MSPQDAADTSPPQANLGNQEFLGDLYFRLESLRLAGVRRIPRILPELPPALAAAVPSGLHAAGRPSAAGAAAPATFAGATSAAAPAVPGTRSWAEAMQGIKNHLGLAPAAQAAAPAARGAPAGGPGPGGSSPGGAGSGAGGAAGGGRSPSGGGEPKSVKEDPALRPGGQSDPAVVKKLAALAEEVRSCVRCPALVSCRTQTVFADGPANAELMFIGEAPGETEDQQGLPFVGAAGKLLDKIIVGGMGMKRADVYICNILKCRPPQNRPPQPDEAASCRAYLDAQIALVQPKIICCLGSIATRFLLDDPTPVGKMRGRWLEYQGRPVRVTYHPAYLLRNYTVEARQKVWDDVREVVRKLRELKASE